MGTLESQTPWNELIDLTGSEKWPVCKRAELDPMHHRGTSRFATFKVEFINKDQKPETLFYCTWCRLRRGYGEHTQTDLRRKGTHTWEE